MDEQAALERFLQLAAIPGPSGREGAVAEAIRGILLKAGVPAEAMVDDGAGQRTRLHGEVGNLIVTLPGDASRPRVLLSAHMDTVPICVGSRPKVEGDRVRSEIETGLGADDRSGCAALLTAAAERLKSGRTDLPPAVLVFFIQEEIGLEGAKHLDRNAVGSVDLAYNFDGGSVDRIVNGAIGGERIDIELFGYPAHAGVAPQNGASTVVMASLAIARLHDGGWLGRVEQPEGFGTANIGVINGGDATNVITPRLSARAEARSYDPIMRGRIVQQMREAFETAAAEVQTADGRPGRCQFESRVDYEAFELPVDHPSILAVSGRLERLGRKPYVQKAGGGLDANWLYQHGIAAVTLGCGQQNIHTADEWLDIPDYLLACRLASELIM